MWKFEETQCPMLQFLLKRFSLTILMFRHVSSSIALISGRCFFMADPPCCAPVRCTNCICWRSLRRLLRRSTKLRVSFLSPWDVRLLDCVFRNCCPAASKNLMFWYLFWFWSCNLSERLKGAVGSTDSSDSSDESGICAVRCSGGVRTRLGVTVGLFPGFSDGTTADAAISGAGAIVGGCTVVPSEIETLTGRSNFLGTVVCTLCFSFSSNAGRPLSK